MPERIVWAEGGENSDPEKGGVRRNETPEPKPCTGGSGRGRTATADSSSETQD